jgi:phosphate-selective porin OprO/OprP
MTLISKKCLAASTLAVATAFSAPTYAQDDFTFKFGGRYMLDYTIADLENPDSKIRDEEIRRFRVKGSGNLTDKVKYKAEITIDPEDNELSFEDAYVEVKTGVGNWAVIVGQDNTTVSMAEQTSSLFSSVYERAAFTDAFGFSRRLGVIAKTKGDNYTFSAGVFSSNLEGSGGGSTGNGKAASARATYNPIKTDDMTVHLGAYWRYRDKGDEENSNLRYRQRPFTHVAPSRIINTGRFAKSDQTFGVEAAATNGKYWTSGEASFLKAKGDGANPDANFGGYYGEVGAFFGGEKVYKGNKFNRPKVDKPFGKGGIGAFSVVARYDSIDLQDEIYTGKLDTIVLGADWWPTRNTRFGINYFDADAENGSADKAEGVVIRAQFDL